MCLFQELSLLASSAASGVGVAVFGESSPPFRFVFFLGALTASFLGRLLLRPPLPSCDPGSFWGVLVLFVMWGGGVQVLLYLVRPHPPFVSFFFRSYYC